MIIQFQSQESRPFVIPTPATMPRPSKRALIVQPTPRLQVVSIGLCRLGAWVGWSVCWEGEPPMSGAVAGPDDVALPMVVEAVSHRAEHGWGVLISGPRPARTALRNVRGIVADRSPLAQRRAFEANEVARAAAEAAVREATPLVVAVDGSFGRGTRGGSWAFLAENGAHGTRTSRRARGILQAELEAMCLALKKLPAPLRLVILSDSQDAIRAVTADAPVPAALTSLVAQVRELVAGRDVEFRWTRGHIGPGLHDGADRLALAARRADESGTPAWARRQIAERIAEESLAAHRMGVLAAAA